jgi:ribonuclease R
MTNTKTPFDPARDPCHERERAKYDNPIPSREFILAYIAEQSVPLSRDKLTTALGFDDPEAVEALRRRLAAMERDGQLVTNRRGGYVPVDQLELIRGRVIGHRDGHGWLAPDDRGERIALSPRDMRGLLHGDRAVVRVVGMDAQGKPEGRLADVLSRANKAVVGRFRTESGVCFVAPQNRRLHLDLIVPPEWVGKAVDGQLVVVAIEQQPTRHSLPIGRVIQVLGEQIEPGREVDAAILEFGIPCEWPAEVEAESEAIGTEVAESDKVDRTDLRPLPLVTIDGPDARDFDDAVYCEPKPSGWRLVVAIADVSHYVRPGSALDEEAMARGNSVYFPGKVVPMLPERLSNGLCSLNPDVDRLCMVCDMLIDKGGTTTRSRFYRGVMRSRARLQYDDVAAMVVERDPTLRKRHHAIIDHLDHLHTLYQALRAAREQRGAIDFETTETQIIFTGGGGIDAVVPVHRNDAHKLIEECMLAANRATARYLRRHRVPALFRNHEGPDADRLDRLRGFLAGLGLGLGGGDDPQSADYAALMERVDARADRSMIQTVMLRSLQQAVYHPENAGHFGLAMDEYAHFTSPIRRYPDLLVHRGIGHIIDGGKGSDFPLNRDRLLLFGEHCSMTERRADEATRDVVMMLKCRYMRDRVGEAFDGVITAVTGFGLFVELDEIHVDGLVHVTQLENDFFRFDPTAHQLRGERSGRVYGLTDRVRVRLDRVDPDERKIDLSMVGPLGPGGQLVAGAAARPTVGKPPRKGPPGAGQRGRAGAARPPRPPRSKDRRGR